jgi:hypothetical protein
MHNKINLYMYEGWATSSPCTVTATDLLCLKLIEGPEGNKPLRIPKNGWEDNIVT